MFNLALRTGLSLSKTSRSVASNVERERFGNRCPSNCSYNDLSRFMNSIRHVLSDAFGFLVDAPSNSVGVPGNLMNILDILVRALLKRGPSGYE